MQELAGTGTLFTKDTWPLLRKQLGQPQGPAHAPGCTGIPKIASWRYLLLTHGNPGAVFHTTC